MLNIEGLHRSIYMPGCTYKHGENFKTAFPKLGKSDNVMPKSDTVKARMFKHYLKYNFGPKFCNFFYGLTLLVCGN